MFIQKYSLLKVLLITLLCSGDVSASPAKKVGFDLAASSLCKKFLKPFTTWSLESTSLKKKRSFMEMPVIDNLHSKEYFGEQRNFWWNSDFLDLMSQRWDLQTKMKVLDVGCGIGHWSRAIAKYFPLDCQVIGIDREKEWIKQAEEKARQTGLKNFSYHQGEAEALPFTDNTFDLVTCQTLLIHVPDVQKVMTEMKRVLRPGGLLAIVEPNNLARSLVHHTETYNLSIEERLTLVRFQLMCEEGKKRLGLGDNSVGDRIPQYMVDLNLTQISVFLSDKTFSLIPPYLKEEERVNLKQEKDFYERDMWIWGKEETKKYFLAGQGREEEFEAYWAKTQHLQEKILCAVDNNKFVSIGGGITYLISGKKSING